MSCEVIGSNIDVQVLTRSGDTLVNNTYVGGPLQRDIGRAISEAMMATGQAKLAVSGGAAAKQAACQALEASLADSLEADVLAKARTDAGCPAPVTPAGVKPAELGQFVWPVEPHGPQGRGLAVRQVRTALIQNL